MRLLLPWWLGCASPVVWVHVRPRRHGHAATAAIAAAAAADWWIVCVCVCADHWLRWTSRHASSPAGGHSGVPMSLSDAETWVPGAAPPVPHLLVVTAMFRCQDMGAASGAASAAARSSCRCSATCCLLCSASRSDRRAREDPPPVCRGQVGVWRRGLQGAAGARVEVWIAGGRWLVGAVICGVEQGALGAVHRWWAAATLAGSTHLPARAAAPVGPGRHAQPLELLQLGRQGS